MVEKLPVKNLLAKRLLVVVGVVALAVAALVFTPPPGPALRPIDPPVTVHDGSLKVEFGDLPDTSQSKLGLYAVRYMDLKQIYISPDFVANGTPLCGSGVTDCPDLQVPWKIVVCDLNPGQTPGPDGQLTCQHGIVTCSPQNPDTACRPKGVATFWSPDITVYSTSNELRSISSTTYQNLDSSAACADNNGHQCNFPGTLTITQGPAKAPHIDTYNCKFSGADTDLTCRVEVGDLDSRGSMLTYLLKKM